MEFSSLTFVTSNRNKHREVEQILGLRVRRAHAELAEIQSLDLGEIIRHKAREAYTKLRRPVLVEDAGLYVDAWHGFPGPLIKWVLETIGVRGFSRLLGRRRSATWVVVYGIFDGRRYRYFRGLVRGTIACTPRGRDGWGFDPLFVPAGFRKTYAELGPQVKQRMSARMRALMALRRFIARQRKGSRYG